MVQALDDQGAKQYGNMVGLSG
uniref:Uncharacterized protein n=1 Tax=Tetranychus urticae TaxID=32264 RepID=T1KCW7_TETUR